MSATKLEMPSLSEERGLPGIDTESLPPVLSTVAEAPLRDSNGPIACRRRGATGHTSPGGTPWLTRFRNVTRSEAALSSFDSQQQGSRGSRRVGF